MAWAVAVTDGAYIKTEARPGSRSQHVLSVPHYLLRVFAIGDGWFPSQKVYSRIET